MRSKVLSFLLLASISVIPILQANAQSSPVNYIPTVFPKSPNSAAFDKYGDYPVNLNSGLPDISIPLYTVESGGLKVPITLSYHAAGYRVDESASWVGMGWSLSAGGSITRNIMGKADEEGYLGHYQGVVSMNPHNEGGLDSLYGIITNHLYDTRPDIYSYNMPGYNGKFFFNGKDAFKPVLIPFSPIQVKGTNLILDEHGNNYLFGNAAKEITSTYYTSGSGSTIATTGWMLETMLSQNRRDTITFSYTSQAVSPADQTGQTTIVEDLEQALSPGGGCPFPYKQGTPRTINSNVASSIGEQEITQISFKNGKVVFVRGHPRTDLSGVPQLDSIIVYQYNFQRKAFEIQKSIVLIKSYFAGIGGGTSKLRLDSVKVLDKAGSILQHYGFTYDTQPVAVSGSFSKDFWGYYNGKMDNLSIVNRTLIPRTQIDVENNGATTQVYIGADAFNTRDPDSVKMQAGILTRIDYPTGGHTDFTYQANRYYDAFSVMHLVGGLRVTSISSYDSPASTTPIVKTYQYNTGTPNFFTTSTGQLNYGFFTNAETYRYWKNMGDPGHPTPPAICVTKRVRTYTSDPSFNLTPSNGNPISYTTVTEFTGTPGVNIGKSVYTYTDVKDYIQTASYTGVPIIYDYSFARGQLVSKTDYLRKADGSYQVVKNVSNSYTAFQEVKYDAVGVVVGQKNVNDGVLTIAYDPAYGEQDKYSYPASSYGIVSDDNYLTGTTTKIYDTADPTKYLTSSVEYKYDNIKHQQANRTRQVDSKGNTLVSVSKYPADYLVGSSTSNVLLDSMLSRNMQAEAIEKWDSLKNVTTGVNAVTGGQLSAYKTGQISGTIIPYKISRLKVAAPLTDFTPSTITATNLVADSRYVEMIRFDSYDSKNNILQYTPRTQTPTTIIWGHNYELPLAQIKNANDNSGTYTNVAYTGFEGDSNGNWILSGVTQYDVTAPTGLRSYNLAGGSVTSPSFTTSKSFILSLWAKGTAPTVTYASASQTAVPLRSANGWTHYEYKLAAGSTQAVVSGTASIDELRLYPVDAQMTTYTYGTDGLIQITDTKSQVSRFEYDFASRLKNIKDWNGNIVKNYGYHTYDMTAGNDAMSGTFTRDNCPPNTTPGTYTYAVAANTYRSSTTASANKLAAYDLNTNGQLKADDPQNCGCPVAMVNFTITNSTGINTFQIKFTGPVTYNFYPTTSSTTVSVQAGTYSIQIFPTGTFANHTYKVGSRSSVTAPGTTFTGVSITGSSNESPLTIQ